MSENGIGHNVNGGLTADQKRALGFHHKGKYEESLAAKKAADAALKNTCKRAIADGISVDDIKLLISLDTPEGEAALREEMQRKIEVAGWAHSDIGTQFSFEDIQDRSPLTERAFQEGKVAGMKGETARSPYDGEAGQEWLRGHVDGQKALMEAIDLTAAGMAEIAEKAEAAGADGDADGESEQPKRRGRPKGSTNKSKADPFADEGENATAH